MSKKTYLLAIALLLAAMALTACAGTGASTSGGTGSGDAAATTEGGAAPNVPASDATVTSEAQGQPASASSDTSGAGDTSGANATGEASTATDVGSGSDGAAGSGGSNAAGGATSPESDTGAPAAGDNTGNATSGTGGTADASGNTTDSGGSSGGEGGAASGTGGNNAQAATPATAYTAVSDAECTEIQGQLSKALGVEVQRATGVASFTDLNGSSGESCQLTVTGTGANFASVPETAMQIRQALSDNGWTTDEQYAADSPTATIGALRRDNQLAAYNVAWSPASGVTCPADQPISACAETLTPEQMSYTITVDLAQQ